MADLGFTCSVATVAGGGGGGGGTTDALRRTLIRTGEVFASNTPLDINSPGPGWVTAGVDVLFANSAEFVNKIQVFHNGAIQLTATSASTNNDVYFVTASGTVAFEYEIRLNDVVQIWGVIASG